MAEETMGVGLGDALQMATRNGNGDGLGGVTWWLVTGTVALTAA